LFRGGYIFGLDLLDTLKLEDGSGFRNFTQIAPIYFVSLLQMIGGEISRKHEMQTISSSINQIGCHSMLSCQQRFFYRFDVHVQDFQAVHIPSKLALQSVEFLAQLLDRNAVFHSQ
jgi:hypothetical protein